MRDEELSGLLREAAEAHRPDRARMLARVERGIAGERPATRAVRPPRAVRPWLRVAGATAAVCGVLAAGAFAVTSAGDDGGARGDRVAAAPSGPPVSPSPAASAARRGPAGLDGLRPENGPLWTGGVIDPHSNPYWAQSNVTLRTTEPLSALTVELRVAQTGGVNTTGSWRSLPETDFAVSVNESGGYLVYRWTLRTGRKVPAGTHTFAGQYNHAEGDRDARGDYVTAHAVRVSGQKAAVGDRFRRDG
ncbi:MULTISPECIES: hypothetical protein [unclassified Streptomyces]|uniref:hypothetical protein n=1 Tax=unclassified Streptomyces TaxID=2593676 RepID=UPI000DAC4D7F|nr:MULTISPECIES: hypothetical protein [unclassified Streptomyces]PZT74425.1 hypothetical protein DNK55_20185 [Streptomyces sp. AC1-42T]PZT82587.1 hypothetical protein DNK56_11260 [Streptomyces sp. AC1-42W]